MQTTAITLPTGIWRAGRHLRELQLRPLAAEDEIDFCDPQPGASPAHRANQLIARCLVADDPAGLVRELPLGDRDALLLHLHRMCVGEQLDAVVKCPAPKCGAVLDVEIAVADLLVAPVAAPAPTHACVLVESGRDYRLTVRRVTAGDQEDIASLARRDPDAATAALLDRCVQEVRDDGATNPLPAPSPSLMARISDALALLDPQAELELHVRCASCEQPFVAFFDPATYLLSEISQRAQCLIEDIHALACAYHWSEAAIVALSPRRRRRYLELLAVERGGRP
jgi:hypothetical protein